MFRRFLAALAAFVLLASSGIAFAAVDVNTADQTQLQTIKGIGPAISAKIVAERQKGNFKDWNDLVTRVPGIGDKNSATMSQGGLTVGGRAKTDAPVTPTAGPPVMPVVKTQPVPPTPVPTTDNGAVERATRLPKVPSTKTTNSVTPPAPAASATPTKSTATPPAPTATTETSRTTKRTSSVDSTSAPATTVTSTTKTTASPAGTTKETTKSKKTDNDATAKSEMAKSKSPADTATTETSTKKTRTKKADPGDATETTPKK